MHVGPLCSGKQYGRSSVDHLFSFGYSLATTDSNLVLTMAFLWGACWCPLLFSRMQATESDVLMSSQMRLNLYGLQPDISLQGLSQNSNHDVLPLKYLSPQAFPKHTSISRGQHIPALLASLPQIQCYHPFIICSVDKFQVGSALVEIMRQFACFIFSLSTKPVLRTSKEFTFTPLSPCIL